MGSLVRMVGDQIAIAHTYVAAPGYRLNVADYAGGATPPHGWEYHSDELTQDHFAQPWVQPTGSTDAYAIGAIVSHSGKRWRSLIMANVWAPGVSGWADADTDIPAWVQPTGAHDAYVKDAMVRHSTHLWVSLLDANVWEPGVANWRKTALVAPGETPAVQEWIQPTGAGDAYALGAHVMHNGHEWVSNYAANVWEPGVFGWTQV